MYLPSYFMLMETAISRASGISKSYGCITRYCTFTTGMRRTHLRTQAVSCNLRSQGKMVHARSTERKYIRAT